ncbi:uncharacterized protein LOC118190403 [Stegodyphus dumicola]|uniref:uncharacterized protein LOC118190403 n=1 Tax=Stegodyphus dumicola TaxID=202533 RepID=UPI0015AA6580|nr:uncharacterized protein LOC118190403 [Stegodyphus dumicola]
MAISKAIKYVKEHCRHNITIKSDSLSTLYAIKDPKTTSSIIAAIQKDLQLNVSFKITLEWIKGHSRIYGNEIVNQLAKEAAIGQDAEFIGIPWPTSHLKKHLISVAISNWQDEWNNSETGKRTHQHFARVNPQRLIANPQLVRFVSGHGPLPKYFERFGISNTSTCISGQLGTPEHYVTNCLLTKDFHIKMPTTNIQAFGKFLVKQKCTVKKSQKQWTS